MQAEFSSRRHCQLYQLGLVPYQAALKWQRSQLQAKIQDPMLPDVLALLEHPPVYTLGQGASLEFVKFDAQSHEYELCRVERGGEVTHHAPGQLVGYPILNLKAYQKDLHWYLRQLETVLIQVLQYYGLPAKRIPNLTGVWVDGYKVAAIGIKVSRWVTMHGFALNVSPDLSGFEHIVPCGIGDKPVGSLDQFVPGIAINAVRQIVAEKFAQVFDVTLIPQSSLKLAKTTSED